MSVIRTFGIQTIQSGSPAPLFGTVLSGGQLTPDQFTGNTLPASNPSLSYLQVVTSIYFRVGDNVLVGPKNNFIYPWSVDGGIIKAITVGSPYSVITVEGLVKTHGAGEYFLLNNPAATVFIVPVVNSGKIYVGSDSNVSSTADSTFDVIPAFSGSGSVPYFHQSVSGGQFNPFQLSEFWIQGSANDTFVARWTEF